MLSQRVTNFRAYHAQQKGNQNPFHSKHAEHTRNEFYLRLSIFHWWLSIRRNDLIAGRAHAEMFFNKNLLLQALETIGIRFLQKSIKKKFMLEYLKVEHFG